MRKSVVALAAIALVAKLFGFIEKQALAYYFGASAVVDAFFVASSVATALLLLAREVVEPAFLPVFASHRLTAAPRSWALFRCLMALVTAVFLPICVLISCFPVATAKLLAPGLSETAIAAAGVMIRISAAASLLLALSTVTYVTLNALGRFAQPAVGDLVQKAAGILACAVGAVCGQPAAALGVGIVVGGLGRLTIHLVGLRPRWREVVVSPPPRRDDLHAMGRLAAPLALGVVFGQLAELGTNFFTSGLGDGYIAAKTYAVRIIDLPILLVPYTLGVVAFPHLAERVATHDLAAVRTLCRKTVSLLALTFAPLSACTVVLAEPIVSLLLERGAFGEQDRLATASALRVYGWGLLACAVEAIVVPTFFAMRDTRTPALLGIVRVCAEIAALALLVDRFGLPGVAFAAVASRTLKVLLLAAILCRRLAPSEFPVALAAGLRIGAAMVVSGAVGLLCGKALAPPVGALELVIHIAWSSTTIFGTFFGCAFALSAGRHVRATGQLGEGRTSRQR